MYRARLKNTEKYVYGAYLYHPVWDKHIIIEPTKDVNGEFIAQITIHDVEGDTVGKELTIHQNTTVETRKFYAGDIVDEGDNFDSVIRFGENELNGFGFYLEEVGMLDDECKPRRHLINAYTTFPEKTKVVGHVWDYTVNIEIVSTPDGDFICRNKREVALVMKNLMRLHSTDKADCHTEKWTFCQVKLLDKSVANNMSYEYFKDTD